MDGAVCAMVSHDGFRGPQPDPWNWTLIYDLGLEAECSKGQDLRIGKNGIVVGSDDFGK